MLGLILLIFLFVLLTALFSFLSQDDKVWWKVYAFLGCCLMLYAGLRPVGFDYDSPIYYAGYLVPNEEELEASYIYICEFVKFAFGEFRPVLIIYALLGVGIKLYAFTRLTPFWFLSLLIYLCHFFILHECTQIRGGVGIAILFFGFYYLLKGQRLKFIFIVLLSSIFHVSMLATLPLAFLSLKPLTKTWKIVWALLIPLSYIFYFQKLSLIAELPIPYIDKKIEVYQDLLRKGVFSEINPFNAILLIKIALTYFLFMKYDLIRTHFPTVTFYLKSYILSVVFFNVLSFLPALAFRITDLYAVSEIILFPLLYYTIKPHWAAKLLLTIFAIVILSINIFYNHLLAL